MRMGVTDELVIGDVLIDVTVVDEERVVTIGTLAGVVTSSACMTTSGSILFATEITEIYRIFYLMFLRKNFCLSLREYLGAFY